MFFKEKLVVGFCFSSTEGDEVEVVRRVVASNKFYFLMETHKILSRVVISYTFCILSLSDNIYFCWKLFIFNLVEYQ